LLKLELKTFQDWQTKSEYLAYLQPLTPGALDLLSPLLPPVKEAGQELINRFEKGATKE
jgi:hypothetical protein